MKSGRKHDLQTNELADWIGRVILRLKPHGRILGWGALGILLAVFVPFLRDVLGLGLLPPAAWALLAGASLVPLLVGQSVLALRKAVRAGGGRDDPPAGTAPAARAADKRAHDR